MNKTLNAVPQSLLNAYNLDRDIYFLLEKETVQNQVVAQQNKQHKAVDKVDTKNSFAVFKYLILTTTIIFSFGGFGFGLILRCGSDITFSQSNLNTNNQSISPNSTKN